MKINSGFSNTTSFLTKELKTANNIKDRSNRQCVERVLKILIEKVKNVKNFREIKNGLCCYVGITSQNNEVCEILETSVVCNKFVYNCGSKFILFPELFENNTNSSNLIVITGDITLIYSVVSDTFTIKKKINGNLIKRQKKGGQSSVRFSRLAEESRHAYIVKILDSLNSSDSLKNNYVMGSAELRDDLVDYSNKQGYRMCKLEFKTSTYDEKFVSANKKEINQQIQKYEKQTNNSNDLKIQQVIELIEKNPDYLLFGDEIIPTECEFIISIEKTWIKGDVLISDDNKYYARLKDYLRIGKKYFA